MVPRILFMLFIALVLLIALYAMLKQEAHWLAIIQAGKQDADATPAGAPETLLATKLEKLIKQQDSSFYSENIKKQLFTILARADIVRRKSYEYSDRLRTLEENLVELLEEYSRALRKDEAVLREGVEAVGRGMVALLEAVQEDGSREVTEQVNFLKSKYPTPSTMDFPRDSLPLVDEELLQEATSSTSKTPPVSLAKDRPKAKQRKTSDPSDVVTISSMGGASRLVGKACDAKRHGRGGVHGGLFRHTERHGYCSQDGELSGHHHER